MLYELWFLSLTFSLTLFPSILSQSPDGKYLASGAIDGIINIFDIATGKLLHTLEGKTDVLYLSCIFN